VVDHAANSFDRDFVAATRHRPFRWQRRLFEELLRGEIPAGLDLPTGLGKTSVMAIWLLARASGAALPRRLVYIVDRRAVVDQATDMAEALRKNLETHGALSAALGLGDRRLPISTLRGKFVDNREWLEDPAAPAIIIGTIDMIGSRLLFSGHGVSRKMRPYHAGLLGADALIVLDEAHLVPPFEALLETIECGIDAFGPRKASDRAVVPPLRLLSLSATGRSREGKVFALQAEDVPDVADRLGARKTVTVLRAEDGLETTLAEQAWRLAETGGANVRCIVYCDRRSVAEAVETALWEKTKGNPRKGVPAVDVGIELFVGARRARERETAKKRLKDYGFLADSLPSSKPVFLIATSAGEVGVDLDADHMVCDPVPWERMVQRLGRVNRRGRGDARIVLIHEGEPKPANEDAPTEQERHALVSWRTLALVEELPPAGEGRDASPGALRALKLRALDDAVLEAGIAAATTPAPLRPALTRPLVDAWSMTSLEDHTGRPDIAPWLRGWVEEEPQTAVVWRCHLPVRRAGGEATRAEIEAFFEAAPPHPSEVLETETWRVVDWLIARAAAAVKRDRSDDAQEDAGDTQEAEMDERLLRKSDVAAFVLSSAGDLLLRRQLVEIAESDRKRREDLQRRLAGATLIVDVRLGGLSEKGLLDADVQARAHSADDDEDDDKSVWLDPTDTGRPVVQFRVHPPQSVAEVTGKPERAPEGAYVFVTKRSHDGEDTEVIVIESWTTEESRATATRPQLLSDHRTSAAQRARAIATAIGLPQDYGDALAIAARLHDEGKQASRWQRAFSAPRDGIYAKTRGPINQALLDGYRHEFGSLPLAEGDRAFQDLPKDLRDLVLHLIAAHHGFARPVIATRGCEDAPPSRLEERARDVALRFAQLQKRWGPWGLAWWEALLRAADQQASRENEEQGKAHLAKEEAG